MFQDTQPAALNDPSGIDPWAQFRVTNEGEIHELLRKLRDGLVPMVMSTPEGASMGTELWSLDTHSGRMNFNADEGNPQLPRMLAAEEAVVVGYLDSVKLQFDLHDLLLVRGARSCTLQSRVPDTVYRFQRRGGYRVRPLERHAPTAQLRHPAIPDMQLSLRVVDVSIGGCALLLPHDVPVLAPGVRANAVQVELDADTRFSASLQIQHLGSIQPGDQGIRVGCEWIALDSLAQRALQRYIDQTQKRRRLLSLD